VTGLPKPLRSLLRWAALMLAMIALGLVALGYGIAKAQSPHHHPLHRDFYRNWLQPGTNKSCCNARVMAWGQEIGDCEPTQAEVRNGDWYAWNRLTGSWLRIPDSRILREPNPNIFDAHLCWTKESGVICFVPPATGG
jgi:hypothetical protein